VGVLTGCAVVATATIVTAIVFVVSLQQLS